MKSLLYCWYDADPLKIISTLSEKNSLVGGPRSRIATIPSTRAHVPKLDSCSSAHHEARTDDILLGSGYRVLHPATVSADVHEMMHETSIWELSTRCWEFRLSQIFSMNSEVFGLGLDLPVFPASIQECGVNRASQECS